MAVAGIFLTCGLAASGSIVNTAGTIDGGGSVSSAGEATNFYAVAQCTDGAVSSGTRTVNIPGIIGAFAYDMLPPRGITATAGTFMDSIALSWGEVGLADGYRVFRNTVNSTLTGTNIADVATTNYDDTAAIAGVTYYYWIKATNACVYSDYSSAARGWAGSVSSGVAADFDGDGKADPAVYDESTGTWKVKLSTANYYLVTTMVSGIGGPGHASVCADFDGDRKADPAVYLELTGAWLFVPSRLNYEVAVIMAQTLGGAGYSGMPADYDGDRFADPCVYNSSGDWRVMLSSAGYATFDFPAMLGAPGYRAVAADYDGDRKADPAVYGESDGLWYILPSSANYNFIITLANPLGGVGYIPVQADYDGDGFADPAVKLENGNEWIVMFSTGGYAPVPLTLLFE